MKPVNSYRDSLFLQVDINCFYQQPQLKMQDPKNGAFEPEAFVKSMVKPQPYRLEFHIS